MCKSCPISDIQNEVINADNSQNSRLTSNLPLIQARIFSYGATSGCIEGGSGFAMGKTPKYFIFRLLPDTALLMVVI